MPRDVEHIVETHRLARARQAAGLPSWDRTINLADVFHNDAMTFEEKRDAIIRRIRRSGWPDQNPAVADLLDELADTTDGDEFDGPFGEIYDEADMDRGVDQHPLTGDGR